MRILICSIIRNRRPYLFNWKDLILCLADENPDIFFDLSVYENDSTDGTAEYLHSILPELQKELYQVSITCEKNDKPYFPSVKDEDRVTLLAEARNRTLDQMDLDVYDKIVFIEPDVDYDPDLISELFYMTSDICSPYSLQPENYPSFPWIYDCWATRVKMTDDEFTGPNLYEMPPCLEVDSTFNCFCVYKAKPFQEGARFSGINPTTGTWDCDTTNICAEFAQRGYDQIHLYRIALTHNAN